MFKAPSFDTNNEVIKELTKLIYIDGYFLRRLEGAELQMYEDFVC